MDNEDPPRSPRDRAYSAMEWALRRIQWGNPGYADNCPVCGRPEERGHAGWCRISKALQAADEARQESRSAPPEGGSE